MKTLGSSGESIVIIALMLLHVVLLNLDEHYFNKKRRQTKFEILSMISDGVFFLIPLLMATFIPYHDKWVVTYKIVAGLSMVSIVKNELFYENLSMEERLTHACLYVLHPILLFTFYESWQNNYFKNHPNFWMFQIMYVGLGVKSISYQLIYWNYIHEQKD